MNKMEPMQASILNYYTDAAYRGHFFCTKDRDRKSHLQGKATRGRRVLFKMPSVVLI